MLRANQHDAVGRVQRHRAVVLCATQSILEGSAPWCLNDFQRDATTEAALDFGIAQRRPLERRGPSSSAAVGEVTAT